MSLGRTLTTLDLYDLLANLIPGIALILFFAILFPVSWLGVPHSISSTAAIAGILVFGFIAGHIIQWFGSRLDRFSQQYYHGGDDLFSRTVKSIRNEDDELPIGQRTEIEDNFVENVKSKFGLSNEFPESPKLLLLVLSYLETQEASRALRFQTIHTFHRSMWSMSVILLFATVLSTILTVCGPLTTSWKVLIAVFVISILATYVFKKRKQKFERVFLRYVFLDFYQNCNK